jgi:hypothetical protein
VIGKLANAAGYQLVWLVSVIGAARGVPYAGPLAALSFALLVLAFGKQRRADLRLIPFALLIGAFADTLWIALGWLDYAAPWPSARLAPAWIVGIWLAFALTLNHSLAFLKRRHALAALLGAIGGPLAYWCAVRGFGAAHFNAPAMTVLIGLGIAWALMVPLFVRIAEHWRIPETHVVVS